MNHERLDVYRCAIQFAALALPLATKMPSGYRELADQLRRAVISIPLNIAEGTGKVSARDKANFYAIARGSAMECAAILDVMHLVKPIENLPAAKDLLHRSISMLTKICLPPP